MARNKQSLECPTCQRDFPNSSKNSAVQRLSSVRAEIHARTPMLLSASIQVPCRMRSKEAKPTSTSRREVCHPRIACCSMHTGTSFGTLRNSLRRFANCSRIFVHRDDRSLSTSAAARSQAASPSPDNYVPARPSTTSVSIDLERCVSLVNIWAKPPTPCPQRQR